MSSETQITLAGNLADDPQLRFTPQGQAVISFRVASTPRTFDRQANTWHDGDALFLTVTAWRQLAESAAESLQRGSRVIVQGNLRQRSYDTRDGDKRTVYEVQAEDIGASLKFASVTVRKTDRGNGSHRQPQTVPAGSGQLTGEPPF